MAIKRTSVLVSVRVTPGQMDAYKAAAIAANSRSLSHWIAAMLDTHIDPTLRAKFTTRRAYRSDFQFAIRQAKAAKAVKLKHCS